jgi:hypothetical protein
MPDTKYESLKREDTEMPDKEDEGLKREDTEKMLDIKEDGLKLKVC